MTVFNESTASVDPAATPQWRYEAIKALAAEVKTRKPKHRRVDPIIEKYASEFKRTGSFAGEAARIATKVFLVDDEYLAEIEARILAGESVEAIASHTRLPKKVIEEYEFLFFDVRRFSGALDWLTRHTTGAKHLFGYGVDNVRHFWCHRALAGGTVILDQLIKSFKENRHVTDAFSLSVYLKVTGSTPPELQLDVAISLIPSSGNGELWHVDFGLERAAINAITDPASKASATRALQSRVIECARLAISGAPLPIPPNWERNKSKQPAASTMENMFAEGKKFRDRRTKVPSSVSSEKSNLEKSKAPGTGHLADVVK